jgi:magnesium transporter
MGSYEDVLARQVLVAFFVPGVVYIADAVGTQTEALVIRGLSVGIGIARVAVREVLTGVVLGALLAALAFPLIVVVWQDIEVAGAVSAALFAASAIATIVAMALPWIFHRLGGDPAFGSGPLSTVVQDLLSVLIYFAIATTVCRVTRCDRGSRPRCRTRTIARSPAAVAARPTRSPNGWRRPRPG